MKVLYHVRFEVQVFRDVTPPG